jgi:hypothetical protein
MPSVSLSSVEWHDLAVSMLSITDCGFELGVTRWIESTGTHALYSLRITDAENVKFNVNGALSPKDFTKLEVSKFEYTLSVVRTFGTAGGVN